MGEEKLVLSPESKNRWLAAIRAVGKIELKKPRSAQVYTVEGRCLEEKGIYPGDVVVVDYSREEVKDGDIVAVCWEVEGCPEGNNRRLQLGIFEDRGSKVAVKPAGDIHDEQVIDKGKLVGIGPVVWTQREGWLYDSYDNEI